MKFKSTCLFIIAVAIAGFGSIAGSAGSLGQYAKTVEAWNRPVDPFRMIGNIYYVGASDIASYLITTPEGHFVIDRGFIDTAPMKEAGQSW
jgi:metallo-beta-lactamase class B